MSDLEFDLIKINCKVCGKYANFRNGVDRFSVCFDCRLGIFNFVLSDTKKDFVLVSKAHDKASSDTTLKLVKERDKYLAARRFLKVKGLVTEFDAQLRSS